MRVPRLSLTSQILVGLLCGILVGYVRPDWAVDLRPLSLLFINLIRSIIAPLIFATLVIGITHTGDIKQVGRMGVKALVYFEIVTTLALAIGLLAVNLTKPGQGVSITQEASVDKATLAAEAKRDAAAAQEAAAVATSLAGQPGADRDAAVRAAADAAEKASAAAATLAKVQSAPDAPAKPQTFGDIIQHLAPASIIRAMADGDVLQIVIFAVLFAIAATLLGARAAPVIRGCEALAEIMFRFTEIVMKFAPIGVGAAMAYTIGHPYTEGKNGLLILKNLALLVATLYGSLIVFVVVVLGAVILIFRVPLRDFVVAVRTPATIAFATTSSESALPRAMEDMERLGVPRHVVGFVLPTGYSFNLDGSTLYLALASVFVAQAAGVEMPIGRQITMMLTLMLTSKGVAGVPRASLVILLGTLASFNLPAAGVLIILGVDELMDMGRTAVNVIGNCLATVVVSKWEGNFRTEPPPPEVLDVGVIRS